MKGVRPRVRVCASWGWGWRGRAQEEIGLLTFMRNDRRVSGRAAVCHLSSGAHPSLLSLSILRLCSHFRLHFLALFDKSFPRPRPFSPFLFAFFFSSMEKKQRNQQEPPPQRGLSNFLTASPRRPATSEGALVGDSQTDGRMEFTRVG